MVVGSLYTYLSILAFLTKPLCGYIVDKFPVKRILFLTSVFGCGLAAFLFNFVQKLPSETVVNLSCDQTTTSLDICAKEEGALLKCVNDDMSKLLRTSAKSIECQVSYVHWYIVIALLRKFKKLFTSKNNRQYYQLSFIVWYKFRRIL